MFLEIPNFNRTCELNEVNFKKSNKFQTTFRQAYFDYRSAHRNALQLHNIQTVLKIGIMKIGIYLTFAFCMLEFSCKLNLASIRKHCGSLEK